MKKIMENCTDFLFKGIIIASSHIALPTISQKLVKINSLCTEDAFMRPQPNKPHYKK
ncbi:MAG TPA: hypothetical protein VJH94_01130 [Candidatus Paceibacterota bacterium]